MFEQIFDSMRKFTDLNVQMQQEMYRRWMGAWPGLPGAPGAALPGPTAEQLQAFPKKWAETVNEVIKRQRETQQEQFTAVLKQIEEAFAFADVKDVDVLRAKTLELWQKAFQFLQQGYEAQARDFQFAVAKWAELFTKAA